jgi:hypothetical protein
MILSFAQWVQSTDFFTALRSSWYVYPVVMSLHLVGIALFGGLVLMTNMRLLGLAMRDHSLSDVINQFRIPKQIGLIMIATCGILMLGSKAEEYYYNAFFRIKLALLALLFVHGWAFRRSVYYNTAEIDRSPQIPGSAKLAACLSLLLWACIACAGRGIGYIDPPLEKLHAGLRPAVGLRAEMRARKLVVQKIERPRSAATPQ